MPQVIACAVIGREEYLLLIRRPGGGWGLPGAPVGHGEWIEDALDRGVRQVLGTGIGTAAFLFPIEDPDGLYMVFDVIPAANDELCTDGNHPERQWVGLDRLASVDLRPAALGKVLRITEPPSACPAGCPGR